ncbi:hypothetical protein QBC46DRAFT_90607, partial [Diplogelasinospora grovesii]
GPRLAGPHGLYFQSPDPGNANRSSDPLLGGGHSLLQGRHGFAADNLVSARLVLADGSAVHCVCGAEPRPVLGRPRSRPQLGHRSQASTSKVHEATEKVDDDRLHVLPKARSRTSSTVIVTCPHRRIATSNTVPCRACM